MTLGYGSVSGECHVGKEILKADKICNGILFGLNSSY